LAFAKQKKENRADSLMWKTEYSYVYPNNRGQRSKLYEPAVVVVVVGCVVVACVVVVVVAETTNRNKTLEDDRLTTYMYSALHIVGLHALTDLHQVACRNEHALA